MHVTPPPTFNDTTPPLFDIHTSKKYGVGDTDTLGKLHTYTHTHTQVPIHQQSYSDIHIHPEDSVISTEHSFAHNIPSGVTTASHTESQSESIHTHSTLDTRPESIHPHTNIHTHTNPHIHTHTDKSKHQNTHTYIYTNTDSKKQTQTETRLISASQDNKAYTKVHNMTTAIINKPTKIEYGKLRCLILDAPSNDNLGAYIEEMKAFGITDLVRTCEPTYDESIVASAGIRVHCLVFGDGEAPSATILEEWLKLVHDVSNKKGGVGVHCVAGLGRAPVLVAVALIEKGMDPLDAVSFIRERRKGAINRRQLNFISSYRRRTYSQPRCCNIM